jgi:hypothetical protein
MLGARSTVTLDGRDLRLAAEVMLAAALFLPLVPGYPGVACPLRTLTGIPCPLCGGTTSVRAALHFNLPEAFDANPGGIAAVVVAVALIVLRPARVNIPSTLIPAALAALWLFQLLRFSVP